MPYRIVKGKGGYRVVKKASGEAIPGTSATHAKAEARIQAINIHEHEGDRSSYEAGGCGCASCREKESEGERTEYCDEPSPRKAMLERIKYADTPVNPFAVCHASTGPTKSKKFEDCVMAVKAKGNIKKD